MKPPRIIYPLCVAGWAFAILSAIQFTTGRLSGAKGVIVVGGITGLAVYFSFFAIRRIRYDCVQTGKVIEFAGDAEIAQGETLQLCHIVASQAVKLRLKLFCKHYEADESFPVQVIDGEGRVVIEDKFVPAFGRFRFEAEVGRESLPLKFLVRNTAKAPRKIQSHVSYAEIAA